MLLITGKRRESSLDSTKHAQKDFIDETLILFQGYNICRKTVLVAYPLNIILSSLSTA